MKTANILNETKIVKLNQKLPHFSDKNSVVKFEFNNLSHIILFRVEKKGGGAGFWHATMNSALIMKKWVGSEAKIHFVVDYYINNTQRLYVCYTDRHISAIIRKATSLGCVVVRHDSSFLVLSCCSFGTL